MVRFREFMSKNQTLRDAGDDRQKFYEEVVSEAKKVCRILFIILILTNDLFQRPWLVTPILRTLKK
jgi:hypothetical protein